MDITEKDIEQIINMIEIEFEGDEGKETAGLSTTSKSNIQNYLNSRKPTEPPGGAASVTESAPVQQAQLTEEQQAQQRVAMKNQQWANYQVSYATIKTTYQLSEKETKCIPAPKKGTGFCPFDGMHFDIYSKTERYGPPNTVATGSPEKLVCLHHQHMLAKRDQIREIFGWANTNSTYVGRKNKAWKVSEFPAHLQNRLIMMLEGKGEEVPQEVQTFLPPVYGAPAVAGMGAGAAGPNPMQLQMGDPGVIKCVHCGGLCRQDAQLCPNCAGSPTSATQKFGQFLGGLASFGAGVGMAQVTGQMGAGVNMLPKYCPQCSSKNLGNAVICSNCGASLIQGQPQQAGPPQYGNAPRY